MLKNILTALTLIVFWIAIGCVFYASVATLVKSKRAGKWPTVDGVIKSSRIERLRQGKGGTKHKAEIIYEYEVDGVTYTGDNIAFGYDGGSEENAKAILDHIRGAKIIVVRYDPSDHQISTLSFGAHRRLTRDLSYYFFAFAVATACLFFIPGIFAEPYPQ